MFKKVCCMSLVFVMLFTFGACKSKKDISSDSSNYSSEYSDLNSLDSASGDSSDNSSDNSSDSKENASNNSSTARPSSKTEVTNSISSVPQSLKNTTLTIYSWNAAKDVPGATTIISKFQKETGIKVVWNVGSYDNYKTEIAAMVAAQTSPDIIRLRGLEPGILSLMDPISVSGYDFKEDYWDTNVAKVYTVKGKTYAVNRKNTLLQQPLVMFYNKELITKYDLDDPYTIWKRNKTNWNWDKFFELCESYKKVAGPDSSPWQCNSFKDYAMTFGANNLKFDGQKFSSNMSDSKLITGYQKMAELRMNGIAYFAGWNMNEFNNGKYLFFGPAIISARKTHFDLPDMKTKGTLGVVPYPCVPGQTTYYQNIFELEAYGIPKGAKNAAAFPYFLREYLNGDNYDKNTFFNDKKTLDVYNYCMNQTTLDIEYDRWILALEYGGDKYQEFLRKLETATPEQIPQVMKTYAPIIENAAKQANNDLANEVG